MEPHFFSKIIVNERFFTEEFKVSSITSKISDGSINFLDFSYKLHNGDDLKEKKPDDFLENNGILNYYEVNDKDNLIELHAEFDSEIILQLTFKTFLKNMHKINCASFLAKKDEKSLVIDLKDFKQLLFYPIFRVLPIQKSRVLYDVLCFDTKTKTILL